MRSMTKTKPRKKYGGDDESKLRPPPAEAIQWFIWHKRTEVLTIRVAQSAFLAVKTLKVPYSECIVGDTLARLFEMLKQEGIR